MSTTTIRFDNISIPSPRFFFFVCVGVVGTFKMYFLSKFQEYNIVINKYSHQAVHSILRTYSSHNWKCVSFTQNLPIPPILCSWQPSVFSLFCYALESYSIISDSWGLPGKWRKNGANSSHSLITLYCSIFLAVLFYKVNIHWPVWRPPQTRRKVRNAHGGGQPAVLAAAAHRAPWSWEPWRSLHLGSLAIFHAPLMFLEDTELPRFWSPYCSEAHWSLSCPDTPHFSLHWNTPPAQGTSAAFQRGYRTSVLIFICNLVWGWAEAGAQKPFFTL